MGTKISRLIKRIQDTQTNEINCSTCLEMISQYVDLELTGQDPARRLPQVKHHIDQCGVCFEEYQLLRDLARMDQAGDAPAIDTLVDQLKDPPK